MDIGEFWSLIEAAHESDEGYGHTNESNKPADYAQPDSNPRVPLSLTTLGQGDLGEEKRDEKDRKRNEGTELIPCETECDQGEDKRHPGSGVCARAIVTEITVGVSIVVPVCLAFATRNLTGATTIAVTARPLILIRRVLIRLTLIRLVWVALIRILLVLVGLVLIRLRRVLGVGVACLRISRRIRRWHQRGARRVTIRGGGTLISASVLRTRGVCHAEILTRVAQRVVNRLADDR